ncbi:MAG: hypothetical protein AB1649_23500, partial [Chloroflexota bacterium]
RLETAEHASDAETRIRTNAIKYLSVFIEAPFRFFLALYFVADQEALRALSPSEIPVIDSQIFGCERAYGWDRDPHLHVRACASVAGTQGDIL